MCLVGDDNQVTCRRVSRCATYYPLLTTHYLLLTTYYSLEPSEAGHDAEHVGIDGEVEATHAVEEEARY